MGTGTIPRHLIEKVTKRQAGIPNVADQIIVKHTSGGLSRIALKVYEQGWRKFTGKKIDIFWPDEEPDEKVYSEGVTRTQASDGGMAMLTFTPLNGMTKVVDSFLSPDPGDTPKSVTQMNIHDCVGGTWPEETPWAGETWTGHYTPEQIPGIIAAWPAHMRRTRALGVPMMGEGMVFQVDEDSLRVPPFQIPKHWPRVCGIDFGIDHPFAAAWVAHDRENDITYLYDTYRVSGATPALHAAAIKPRGLWIPVAWPHDGINREKSGEQVVNLYKKQGLNMMANTARYKNDKGGRQDREPGVVDLFERMLTGRFKVFSSCEAFFEEMRTYHRKDGKIVPVKDDLISANHYAHMELRHAMLEMMPVGRNARTQRGLRQYG